MTPLNLPGRHRKTGQYIYCGKGKTNVSDKCCQSGKALRSCKFASLQRFESKVYDSAKRRMVRLKIWEKDLRDFEEFDKKHIEVVSKGKIIKLPSRPTLLRNCMQMYYDWLHDIDVPAHKKKGYSQKWLKQVLSYLINFRNSLSESGINIDYLSIKEIDDSHTGIFHEYLKSMYGNKTYNHHISQLWKFFDYFINEKGYDLKNPFDGVSRLKTESRVNTITMDEFNRLIGLVTPDNGFKIQKVKGRPNGKKRTFYKPWLIDSWKLSLYTGLRTEDIPHVKKKHCHPNHILAYERKTDRWRYVPMIHELKVLVDRLTKEINEDDYLIGTVESSRTYVQKLASEAFSHYISLLNLDRHLILYDLRNTYATQAKKRFGEDFQKLFNIHSKEETTQKHYINKAELIENYTKPMWG